MRCLGGEEGAGESFGGGHKKDSYISRFFVRMRRFFLDCGYLG